MGSRESKNMEQGTSISELSMTGTRDLQPDNVPAKTVTDGYEKLAELMSLKPETAIFRRFQTLIVTNLLRLQAELQDMEHELAEIRSDDAQSQDAIRKGYRYDFRSMRDWKETGDSLQYDLLVAIGEKLAEYSKQAKTKFGSGITDQRYRYGAISSTYEQQGCSTGSKRSAILT